jgi:hypothetical protein
MQYSNIQTHLVAGGSVGPAAVAPGVAPVPAAAVLVAVLLLPVLPGTPAAAGEPVLSSLGCGRGAAGAQT